MSPLPFRLAVLVDHLGDLRDDGFLIGGGVARGIGFARLFGILFLQLEGGDARLVDRDVAGAALDLFLLLLFVGRLLGLVFVDQTGFE